MDDFIWWIGALTIALVVIFATWVIVTIIGNIYGGIKGAFRIRTIHARNGSDPHPFWKTVKMGFKAWGGARYNGETGHFVRMGFLEVPLDGRDPIYRDRQRLLYFLK